MFLKRPSNYSAGLARVNSTSGPSATPQKRSIFRPVGWVETFGPLMPAVAIFQKGLPLDGWLLKGVQGCHGQVLALASQRVRAVQTLAASPHVRAVCRPLPLHRTRALCADPRRQNPRCLQKWHGQVLCSTCFTARARCADPCRPNPRCAGPIVRPTAHHHQYHMINSELFGETLSP